MSDVIETPFNKLLYRPCIIVSTISENKVSNAAPFSFNSPATTKPPTYGFCCEVKHDTLRNIKQNKEFVVNLVDENFGPIMKNLARDLPYGVSEILESDLNETPSKKVKPPRITEAYGWIECRLTKIVDLSPHAVWVLGKVLVSEIRKDAYDSTVNVEKVKPLCHIWGEDYVIGGKRVKHRR
ncbi:flavin reductase family protein [Candidatus Bathyarchaeota archaeon]|nr:flavin reductase family protein [Candidatus Bathyarchaeota archaeon]